MQTPADREAPRKAQPRRARPVVVRGQPGLDAEEQAQLSPRAPVSQLGPRLVSRLQAQAGNSAVSRLVLQRRDLSSPSADPKFRALTSDVRGKQKRLSAHPPAKGEAEKAAKAAKAPPDDKQAHGKAAQAEKMNAAKPGEFNKAAFIAAVNEAINKQAPKNLNEAKDYGESGKANAIKGEVAGKVNAGKKASAAPVESATKAAPDTSKVKDKPVTPLTPDQPPGTPGTPNPAQAVPDKAPAADTDFSEGPKQVDGEMTEAGVTEGQLAKSNEPEFTGALDAKKEGEEHSATAPGQIRAHEAQTIGAAKTDAAATGAKSMASMAMTRKVLGARVAGGKQATRSADELKRAKVAGILQKVFDATKTEVEVILNGIDAKVDAKFDTGEKAARDAFTAEHTKNMKAYKKRRYSGLRGKYRWVRDKFKGLPSDANKIFDVARKGYVNRMKQVIASVADVIAGELNRAKARIARGRTELQAEVTKLPKDLKAIGKKAAGEFAEQFDELTESVDNKGSELVQTLATKYKDALGKVDEEIEAEKEKNSGLIARAINAIKGVIKAILELKDLLLGVLAKAAEAALAIISDPIGFLGNLISQVGAGLSAFMGNLGEHLKKGLVSWLLGSAGSMGIEIPKKFDLQGIIGMIAGMLGLTWDSIKARVIARGIPAKVLELAEGSLPLIAKLRSEGVGGIWEAIVEKVGDIKETLFTKISEYLVPEVLKAGIVWIVSLLNPASAFIKACKMIVDIVTFIVTRGKQIIEFVHAVLDAVIAIAKGAASGVPALIENALSKSIPVLIGALASILGISGIADKVKKFIQSLSKPIMKAIDWVTDKIVGVGRSVWTKMKAAGTKIKSKAQAGIAKVKAKIRGGDDSPAGKQARLDKGMGAALGVVNRFAGRTVGEKLIKPLLAAVRLKYGLTSLSLADDGQFWSVVGVVNPSKKSTSRAKSLSTAGLDALVKAQQSARKRVKNDLKIAWNNNSVKKTLATDPVLKKALEKEFNRLTNAIGRREAAYDSLVAGKATTVSVPRLVEFYHLCRDAADVLIQRLNDVPKSPAELSDEATKARAELQSARQEAVKILAEAPVASVIKLPSFAKLAARLKSRKKYVDDAIANLSSRSLAELRGDVSTAKSFWKDANSAKALTNIAEAIKPSLESIEEVCKNTGPRAGAIIPPGTSEAAAIHEAKTGRRVKERAHGPKCAMEARGLRREIARLDDLRSQTTDAGVLKQIKDAVDKATERANALDTGANAWRDRVKNDPDHKVWNPEDGTSKIEPGFGQGI